MLSLEDNEYLCRVGPGTPMGDLFRQYWLPAIRSDELPAPDCPPLRVKLLGEELIGFRTTSGAVGLIQNACPHRGASLFFGRNEEEGLRCVYHGWKFDVTGACTDMPSEPAESNFKNKVRARAYPTHERNGIIWAYMGPREVPPPLPEIEANLLCKGAHEISVLHRPCNWMQGWEGEMDTVHAAFLHGGQNSFDEYEPGSFNYYQYRERSARFSTIETEYGLINGAYRPAEEDTYYWRVTQILLPFYNMIPTGKLGEGVRIGIYVPMDDEHTLHWEINVIPGREDNTPMFLNGAHPVPNRTGWYGRFNVQETLDNDYLIDRELQRRNKGPGGYTGIVNGRLQDAAVTETMGPIYDRSREHLGTTDQFIIRARRRMIMAARALREQGLVPPGVDQPDIYRQRSGEMILPRTADWWEAYQEIRRRVAEAEAPVNVPQA
jgi:phthalate 4,5-dioxygenase oxygenase subunit